MGLKVGNMDGVPDVGGTRATESDVGDVRRGGAGHRFYIELDEHAHEVCVHLAAVVAGDERGETRGEHRDKVERYRAWRIA